MKSVALHNLGCKVNTYELDVMRQKLHENGYFIVPFDEVADIYIVCSMFVIFFLILFKFKDDDLTKLFKKIPDDSEDK